MIQKIIDKFNNKKVAILGFGREGKSTYKFLRKYTNCTITIHDKNENLLIDNPNLKENNSLSYVLGNEYLNNLNSYDYIIKSPGICLDGVDVDKDKITSECNLLLEETSIFVIGITGTKGKSTTSSLIYKTLLDQDLDVYLCGNIGTPIFEYIDKAKENSIFVVEMSAYQTEYLRKSPHIGIILNLFEEHLDYFKTEERYFSSKLNMFRFQNKEDYALYSLDNGTLKEYVNAIAIKSKKIGIISEKNIDDIPNNTVICDEKNIYTNFEKLDKVYDLSEERLLVGRHNIENIMFVFAIAKILKLDLKKAIHSINNFAPLEHRMEFVGTFKGINFYNDSIATIPSATINCIESLKNIETIIIGGKDRGIDYSTFIEYLKTTDISNIICLPDTGNKIGNLLKDYKKVYFTETVKEAVIKAYEVTSKGKTCVMSPAASSYNKYKSFEEKGREYKEWVKKEAVS